MTDQDPEKTAAEQALDHALEVLRLRADRPAVRGASLLPQLVEKGKSQVTMARMIGQFAVTQGSGEAGKIAGRLQDQAITVLAKLGGATPSRGAGHAGRASASRSPRPPRSGPQLQNDRRRPSPRRVRPSTSPRWPSPTTTVCRRRTWSTALPVSRRPSSRPSGPTRAPTAAARRSCPRSPSSRSGSRGRGLPAGRRPPTCPGSSSWWPWPWSSNAARRAERCGPARWAGASRSSPTIERVAGRSRRASCSWASSTASPSATPSPTSNASRTVAASVSSPTSTSSPSGRELGLGEALMDGWWTGVGPAGASGSTAWRCPVIAEPRTSSRPSGWSLGRSWCTGASDDALPADRRSASERWSSITTGSSWSGVDAARRRATGPFPGDGVERGETLAEAVVRELSEETGLEGLCVAPSSAGPSC